MSPYLNRPLRTLAMALSESAAMSQSVTLNFSPLEMYTLGTAAFVTSESSPNNALSAAANDLYELTDSLSSAARSKLQFDARGFDTIAQSLAIAIESAPADTFADFIALGCSISQSVAPQLAAMDQSRISGFQQSLATLSEAITGRQNDAIPMPEWLGIAY